MGTLPASVRLALWSTAAWNGAADRGQVIERSFPDFDDVSGDLGTLELWPQIGERMLLCALPHPGRVQSLPSGGPAFVADALEAGECVYVPMSGGALVPVLRQYGHESDHGWQATLHAYDCAPTPIHTIEMLTAGGIERELMAVVGSTTAQLEAIDAVPWQASTERNRAAAQLQGPYGLPNGIPARLAKVIWTAATASAAAQAALDLPPSAGAYAHSEREMLLREMLIQADQALADATNLACLTIAGLVPDRP